MRIAVFAASLLAIIVLGFLGLRYWQYQRLWPKVSSEVVQLTPPKRELLQRLRSETKFGPNDFPPLGYTGAATPEDREIASAAVDKVIDTVLARADGPLPAKDVSVMIGDGMHRSNSLETEDRERAQGYMLEIWYILGFKGATGRFAYGDGVSTPPGYAEPLPPGWTAPDKPRPIG